MARCLMWAAVVSLVFAGAASASVKQGDTELDLLAGFTMQNGAKDMADFDAWFFSAALGYFLTDNIQVQVAGLAALTSQDFPGGGSQDVDVWGIGGRAKYHFMPTNQLVPYVGVQIMWVNADVDISPGTSTSEGSNDGTLWGPLVGARYELNENNDVYLEYQYQLWSGDVGDVFDDGHLIVLGIIHQFK
jgi:predicted porin